MSELQEDITSSSVNNDNPGKKGVNNSNSNSNNNTRKKSASSATDDKTCKSKSHSQSQSSLPSWLWIVGLLGGLFIIGMMYLHFSKKVKEQQELVASLDGKCRRALEDKTKIEKTVEGMEKIQFFTAAITNLKLEQDKIITGLKQKANISDLNNNNNNAGCSTSADLNHISEPMKQLIEEFARFRDDTRLKMNELKYNIGVLNNPHHQIQLGFNPYYDDPRLLKSDHLKRSAGSGVIEQPLRNDGKDPKETKDTKENVDNKNSNNVKELGRLLNEQQECPITNSMLNFTADVETDNQKILHKLNDN